MLSVGSNVLFKVASLLHNENCGAGLLHLIYFSQTFLHNFNCVEVQKLKEL